MRSAIFDSGSRQSSGPQSKNPLRSRQSSPSVSGNTRISRARNDQDKQRIRKDLYLTKPRVSWNLEEMISAYLEYKTLPPILSPTLPIVGVKDKEDFSDTPLTSILLEKSMSPKKKARVRWVNKMSDAKPKFLIRFQYNADKLDRKVTGLGISVRNEKKDMKESESKPELKKNPEVKKELKVASKIIPKGPAKIMAKASIAKEEKRDSQDEFVKLKTYWIKLAKESKFISNKTDGILSLIIELDALILYAISYFYDDKLKQKLKTSPLTRYWTILRENIETANKKIELSYLNGSKNENIQTHLKCLVKFLYQFDGVVLKRLIDISESLAKDEKDPQKKLELQFQIINHYRSRDRALESSENACPHGDAFLRANYPIIWDKKCKSLSEVKEDVLPMSYNYYMPFGSYTQLGEFIRAFYHFLNEFINLYNKVNNEDLIYSLKSGLAGP